MRIINQTLTKKTRKCLQTLGLSLALLPMMMGNNQEFPEKANPHLLNRTYPESQYKNLSGSWNVKSPFSSHFTPNHSAAIGCPALWVPEICDNGIDDDGDGFIDNADPDCGCSQTIMLVARDNGKILKVNLATGGTSAVALTSPYVTGNLNAISANPDKNLVYYCRDKMVYYWEPSTGEQGIVVDLQGKIGNPESLSSGGGEYYNGYLYLGTENGNPGVNPKVWRQQLSANGKSVVGNPVNLNVPIPSNTSWGDLIITPEGGQTVIYGMTAAQTSHFWKYNIATNTYTTIRNDLTTEMQIGVDIDGNTWAGSLAYGMIQKIDRATGNFYGNAISFGGNLWDLTGPINCPQAVEICGNGLDDDNDGYTDNQDQDCLCPTITPGDALTRSICEGETVTFQASTNAPNPPYTHIEFYRFAAKQANPYTSTDAKVWLGEFPNNGTGVVSTTNFPVSSGNSATYYVYGLVKPAPQYPGTCAPMVEYTMNVTRGPIASAGNNVTVCNGTATTLSAGASGANGPYTYTWSNGLGTGATKSVSPAATTTYTVTVTAANGCTSSDQVMVAVSPSPVANAGANQTICSGDAATLTATATGGVGPFAFAWNNALGDGATKVVTPNSTKTYIVTVTGSNGCVSTAQVTVTVTSCVENCTNNKDDDGDGLVDCADPDCAPDAEAGMDASICTGSSISLTASVNGSTGNYTYTWNNGLGSGPVKTVSPATSTDYIVSISNTAGCTGVDTIRITVEPCAENCTNGVDDDGDGLVDCADPDCSAVSAPQLADDQYTTCPGLPFTERVTYNDGNLQNPVFSIFTQPASGTASIDQTGKFVYTPIGLACTTDVFVYQVCNQTTGCCDQAAVTMILGDNTPPILQNVPADLTIGCDDAVPSPPIVFGYDSCPGIYINYGETTDQYGVGACESYQIIRTWVATDLCGNSSTGDQVITVQDLSAPQLLRVYTLPNGKRMVAGVARRSTDSWKYVSFPINFGSVPVVFSQVTSFTEQAPVVVRQRNVSVQGFELKLKEEDASNGLHSTEDVAWLAIEPGSFAGDFSLDVNKVASVDEVLKSVGFSLDLGIAPTFVATAQTNAEGDAITPRFSNLAGSGLDLFLDEESSKDSETAHTAETLGYLAMSAAADLKDENGDFIGESGTLSLTNTWATINLNHNYTHPVVVMGGVSNNDTDPVTVRVRNVTANSFQVRLQEWAYQDGAHGTEQVGYLVLEGSVPKDLGFYCDGKGSSLVPGTNLFAQDNCDDQLAFNYSESESLLAQGLVTSRNWTAIDDCGNVKLVSRFDTCIVAALQLKTMLHGAFVGNGGSNLMRDDLRAKGLIPVQEPFTALPNFAHKGKGGGEVINPALLQVAGPNAIVDWVFVEIRDAAFSWNVLATRSALLQRDGDVVDTDGGNVLYFSNLPEGEYYVAIRHRNHLGIMTDSRWVLSSAAPPTIDFTNPSLPARGFAGTGKTTNGVRMQWAGDLNGDRKVIYQGPNNDIFYLFSRVLADPENSSILANYISNGYDLTDLNLDGKSIYQGPGNERAMQLYQTVLSHPGNGSFLANYIVLEYLP